MRNWIKTIFFASAFSPMLLVAGALRYGSKGTDSITLQLIFTGFIALTLPFIILIATKKLSESLLIQVKKVKSNDDLLIPFILSYLLPLLKLTYLETNTVFFIISVSIIVLWMTGRIPSHPILFPFGYRFFEIESEQGVVYILISKRKIRNTKNINYVKKITDSMLLEE